jgi:hypothetical protein
VSHSGNQRPQSLTQTPGPTRRTTPARQPASPPLRHSATPPEHARADLQRIRHRRDDLHLERRRPRIRRRVTRPATTVRPSKSTAAHSLSMLGSSCCTSNHGCSVSTTAPSIGLHASHDATLTSCASLGPATANRVKPSRFSTTSTRACGLRLTRARTRRPEHSGPMPSVVRAALNYSAGRVRRCCQQSRKRSSRAHGRPQLPE